MDSLTSGRIPAFYREVYELVCPSGSRIDRETFTQLLQSPTLSPDTLMAVWDSVESFTGYVTKDGFFKALALIALGTRNLETNVRALDDWGDREFPLPDIGTVADLKARYQKLLISRDPLQLSLTFADMCNIDTVTVELAERRGVFFKHQEYKVTSQRYRSTVYRRYSDFDAFRDYLIQRFPYRLVPALPPKSAILNSSKMERRKKQLLNFLSIVARHPAMCDDSLVKAFLIYAGSDVLSQYKVDVERIPDEFMTNEIAPRVKDRLFHCRKSVVHGGVVEFLSNSNTVLRDVTRRVTRLVETLRAMLSRLRAVANDVAVMAAELRALTNLNPAPHPGSANGESNSHGWAALTRSLAAVADPVREAGEKGGRQAAGCEEGVLATLELFLALLEGYESLLQRLEKGVAAKHKQAITKMTAYRKRQISATTSARGHNQDEANLRHLEQRIIEQDRELSDQENRVQFSQFCQLHEIQLVYKHVDLVQFAILNLVKVNAIGHAEVAQVWQGIQPTVEKIVAEIGGAPIMPST